MAAGEYVSVHSQADTEHADVEHERAEPRAGDKGEHEELAGHCHVNRKFADQRTMTVTVHAATVTWRHVSIA